MTKYIQATILPSLYFLDPTTEEEALAQLKLLANHAADIGIRMDPFLSKSKEEYRLVAVFQCQEDAELFRATYFLV